MADKILSDIFIHRRVRRFGRPRLDQSAASARLQRVPETNHLAAASELSALPGVGESEYAARGCLPCGRSALLPLTHRPRRASAQRAVAPAPGADQRRRLSPARRGARKTRRRSATPGTLEFRMRDIGLFVGGTSNLSPSHDLLAASSGTTEKRPFPRALNGIGRNAGQGWTTAIGSPRTPISGATPRPSPGAAVM
jgi:hypothetical protein